LLVAVSAYQKAGHPVPREWSDELADLWCRTQ
jgi:hypothetical protein